MIEGKDLVRWGNIFVVSYPHLFFRVLGGILSISIDTAYDVKCVHHRLMQDLGSSPGTLFGCAPVRTQGPSHKSYGKPKRDCIK